MAKMAFVRSFCIRKIQAGHWIAVVAVDRPIDISGRQIAKDARARIASDVILEMPLRSRRVGEGPVRTGVTAVFPRKDIWSNGVFAATHALNGDGEMTGTHWIRDLETLNYPIMLTNTGSVGGVMDAVTQYTAMKL